jgi:hypothetical protein
MRYLKTYKLFESLSLESEITEIFLPVSDMTYIKFDTFSKIKPSSSFGARKKEYVSISIGLSNRVTPDESGKSKWGVKYRELINGDVIAEEIANSISICVGMGFKVERAEVSWVNAGEWKLANPDKEGTGPGLLKKIFEGKKVGPIDMVDKNAVKARYSTEMLPDFIIDKGTRLRHIQIVFKY